MTIEIIGVPVLLKTVDFLFGQAKLIIQDWRERRANQQPNAPPEPPAIPLLDESRDEVLGRRISEALLAQQTQTIEALWNEMQIYERNRQHLSAQASQFGGVQYAPLIVVNQLQAQELAILERSQKLAKLLQEISS